MTSSSKPTRFLLCLLSLGALIVPLTGCGTNNDNPVRGRQLFLANCATCHTLAQAGQGAQIGPNLDDAFAAARASGQDSDTIAGVVQNQIEYPRPSTTNPAVSMPADLVTGQAAKDVAAYVGMYAGVPGAAPPSVPGGPGAQVFADNVCGSCHTLAVANSGGTTGPNLDQNLVGMPASEIKLNIVNPNAHIAQGYPPNVMPQNYGTTIPADQLNQLVQYLVSSTSGHGGSATASGSSGSKGSQKASKGSKKASKGSGKGG